MASVPRSAPSGENPSRLWRKGSSAVKPDCRTVPSAQPTLERALGVWGASSIVVGTVIGSGVFLVPSSMIRSVGSVQTLFVVWIVAGLLSLFGALTYAELVAA